MICLLYLFMFYLFNSVFYDTYPVLTLYLCLFADQRNGCEDKLLTNLQLQCKSNELYRLNSGLIVKVAAYKSPSQHSKSSNYQSNKWHFKTSNTIINSTNSDNRCLPNDSARKCVKNWKTHKL